MQSTQPSYKKKIDIDNHTQKLICLMYTILLHTLHNCLFLGEYKIFIITFPKRLIFSFRYFEDNTADTITLNAPKGVTNEAGANA